MELQKRKLKCKRKKKKEKKYISPQTNSANLQKMAQLSVTVTLLFSDLNVITVAFF